MKVERIKEERFIKKPIIKTIIFAIVTILLGGIGSGLWELILKPSLGNLSNLILDIITFGTTSLKNNVYANVAKGLHNQESLLSFLIFTSIIMGICISVLFRKLLFRKPIVDKLVKKKTKFIKIVSYIYIVRFISIFFIETCELLYINETITYYNQLNNICLPYIDETQEHIFASQFAQITCQDDYSKIIVDLKKIANKNNIKVKSFKY